MAPLYSSGGFKYHRSRSKPHSIQGDRLDAAVRVQDRHAVLIPQDDIQVAVQLTGSGMSPEPLPSSVFSKPHPRRQVRLVHCRPWQAR